MKKMKRMDDGGPVEMTRRKYRDEDRDEMREDRKNDRMERRAARMKMREERMMRRGPGMNREEMMKRVGEKLGPMAGKIGPVLQKIGQGIGGMMRKPSPPTMGQPGVIAPPVRPVIPQNTTQKPAMRGGGLAKKGVGQALAKGGLVNANGCAKRGKTRGKMV